MVKIANPPPPDGGKSKPPPPPAPPPRVIDLLSFKPTLCDELIPADNFVAILAVNVENQELSDLDFRELVRNTLPIVSYKAKGAIE